MKNNSKKKLWQQPNNNASSPTGTYFALFLSFFLGPFGLGVVAPIFAGLILSSHFYSLLHGLTLYNRSILLGLLIAVFPLFQYLGSSVYIYFSKRFSRKHLLMVSALAQCLGWIGGVGALYANSYLIMLITRVWTGWFAGSYVLTLIPDVDHLQNPNKVKKYHKFLSLLSASGFIIGVCVGGILSDHTLIYAFSNVLAFLISALLCLFAFFMIYFTFPKKTETFEGHPYKDFSWTGLIRKKRMKKFIPFLFLYFVFFMGYFPFLQFFSYFIHVTHGGTKLFIAYMLVAIGGSYFFGLTILWKIFSTYFPRKIVSSLTFLTLVACSILIANIQDIYANCFFHIILAACAGNCVKIVSTYLMSKKALIHAELISYHEATSLLAACISPLLAGLVLLINIYAVYYLIASFFFVGLVYSFFVKDDN